MPVRKVRRSRGNEASIKPQTASRTRKPQEQAAVGKPQLARTQVEQTAKRERREVKDGESEACGVDSPSGGTCGLTPVGRKYIIMSLSLYGGDVAKSLAGSLHSYLKNSPPPLL